MKADGSKPHPGHRAKARSPRLPRVLAVSSGGGHWVQLCRLALAWRDVDLITACSAEGAPMPAAVRRHQPLPDATRWDRGALVKLTLQVGRLVLGERPDLIVTTGAAPGLLALIWGRLIGAHTVWIDSLANVRTLSASGRAARWIAHECLTQWPHLQHRRVAWKGSVW